MPNEPHPINSRPVVGTVMKEVGLMVARKRRTTESVHVHYQGWKISTTQIQMKHIQTASNVCYLQTLGESTGFFVTDR